MIAVDPFALAFAGRIKSRSTWKHISRCCACGQSNRRSRGIAEKATLTGRFLAKKMKEFDRLRGEIDALRQEA